MDHHLKSQRPAEFTQFSNAALGAVTKTKIGAFMNLDRAQRIMNNRSDEFRRPHAGELRGERQHQDSVDAGVPQQLESRLQRRNQLGTSLRTQKAQRVRIEGNRYGPRAIAPRRSV